MPLMDATEPSCESSAERMPPALRVAVVGCGPKGLFCLERLASGLDEVKPSRPLHISLFESSACPGAGLVYDPRQPRYLRMNFASEYIDVWHDAGSGSSLLSWLHKHHPEFAAKGRYLPRAVVGEYLGACFETVVHRLGKRATILSVQDRVSRIERAPAGWQLVTTGRQTEGPFDEVLVAVGHERWREGRCDGQHSDHFDVACVYPTERQLSIATVPRGCRVALRGMGLTAIDAILAMTEGRGGSFEEWTDGPWRYSATRLDPAVIMPYARSGRPMLAKPEREAMAVPNLQDLWDTFSYRLDQLHHCPAIDFDNDIWPLVYKAAEQALQACGGSGALQWFEGWRRTRPSEETFRELLGQSISVATGRRRPDAAWAWGETWRRLYSSLVRIISFDGLRFTSWPSFRAVAREMERIAFGPPAENCQRLVALIKCGRVDLRFLHGKVVSMGPRQRLLKNDAGDETALVDCHVNAVLPASGDSDTGGPLESLAREGRLMQHPSRCGYRIDRTGRPIAVDGVPLDGLTLVGRPTEGSVLGNDTLNPTLHDLPTQWAGRIVARCQQSVRSRR